MENVGNKNMKGQALVELGISLVILLMLLGGIVEFGIIFFQYIQLRDAAQEGALYASVCDCDVLEIEERVRGASDTPINLSDSSVVVDVSVVPEKDVNLACEGDGISVRVSYNHHIFMPFIPQLIGRSDVSLSAVVTDTVLRPVCP